MGDLPITAQGFDQVPLPAVEAPEHFIAFQQLAQLAAPFSGLAVQQQPHILYRGAGAAVIQVDKQHGFVTTQDVAGVAVSVNAQGVDNTGLFDPLLAAPDQVRNQAVPRWPEIVRYPATLNQQGIMILNALHQIKAGAVLKAFGGAQVVDLAQPLAETIQGVGNAGIRRLSAPLGEHREPEVAMPAKGFAVLHDHGGDDRNVCGLQLQGKLVFFHNGCI